MGYFKVKKIGSDTYQLFEKKGVGEILVSGTDKSLIIDTGYGHPDLLKTIGELTDKPVIVLNTHIHADHANGNGFFDKAYAGEEDFPKDREDKNSLVRQAKSGIKRKFFYLYPFIKPTLESFELKQDKLKLIPAPEQIDLGGRVLEIMKFPGHTPGSIIILDRTDRCIYTGDGVNNFTWLFTNPTQKIAEYNERVKKLSKLEGFDYVWVSHGKEKFPFSFFADYSQFLTRINYKKSFKIKLPNFSEPFCVYREQHPELDTLRVAYFPTQL